MEIWKDIAGYEGLYQVSNLGNVKSIGRMLYDINKKENVIYKRNKLLKSAINNKGYKIVKLQKCCNKKTISIHRLVALTFIPNPNNLPQINHIDGNKQNNNVNNLEWCDNTYNHNHAIKNNLCKSRKVILQDKNGKEYYFNNLHLMFKFLNLIPNGNYIKFINKNILYHNYYLKDWRKNNNENAS